MHQFYNCFKSVMTRLAHCQGTHCSMGDLYCANFHIPLTDYSGDLYCLDKNGNSHFIWYGSKEPVHK